MEDKIQPIKFFECPQKDCPCNTGEYGIFKISGYDDEKIEKMLEKHDKIINKYEKTFKALSET